MSPHIGDRVREVLGPSAAVSWSYGEPVADVDRERWHDAAASLRDELAPVLFDLLTAVDREDDGFEVVLRLWSLPRRAGVRLRTCCPRDDARVPTVTDLFAGAHWHERQLWEMFGVLPEGHPQLEPLLLPAGFAGAPLRKDFVLASRAVRLWPGAPEPGQSVAAAAEAADRTPSRRRPSPPGVPAPGTWRRPAPQADP